MERSIIEAVEDGDIEEVSSLIESGASLEETSSDGSSPLILALNEGSSHKKIAILLIEYG